jgi:hypothetical protein
MPSGAMTVGIKDYAKLCQKLKKLNKDSETVISRTVSDFKTRAPGWVAQEVTKEYTIKKGEVNDSKTGTKKAGSIRTGGKVIDNLQIIYKGRELTPIHFKMSPKKPSTARQGTRLIPGQYTTSSSKVVVARPLKEQTITFEVHKGQRKVLRGEYEPKPFLASNGYGQYIPFQRRSEDRNDLKGIKSTSVPQMIENEDVKANIEDRIDQELQKRLEHHAEQIMMKQ